MHYALRKALFFLFVGIFLVSAPLVVLYTAGYRFNHTNNIVSQTGTLAVASLPRGATVFLSGERDNEPTPATLQRLTPGIVSLRIEKEGLHTWERTIRVKSGETTYITAPLFFADAPLPIAPESRAWDNASEAKIYEPIALPSTFSFTQEGNHTIALHVTSLTGTDTILTLLPEETYTPLALSDTYLILQNTKGEAYSIERKGQGSAVSIGKNISITAWEPNEELFAWANDNEVWMFNPRTQTSSLITRQSERITALAFTHNGAGIVVASPTAISGWDSVSYENGRQHTLLFTLPEETEVWFAQNEGVAYLETLGERSWLKLAP